VGRQLPFLSLILPAYLVLVIEGRKGWRRTWPAALMAGASFALAQFAVSNFWSPYATDIIASLVSITAVVAFLHFWKPAQDRHAGSSAAATANPGQARLSTRDA